MAENNGQSFAQKEALRMNQMNVQGDKAPQTFAEKEAARMESMNVKGKQPSGGLRQMTSSEQAKINDARANLTGDAAKQYQAALDATNAGLKPQPIESPRTGQNESANTQNALNAPTPTQQSTGTSMNAPITEGQYAELAAGIAEAKKGISTLESGVTDFGSRFGELLNQFDKTQEVYSRKLTEISQKNFAGKTAEKVTGMGGVNEYSPTGTLVRGGEQGMVDREPNWDTVRANLGFGTVKSPTGDGTELVVPTVTETVAADPKKSLDAAIATDFVNHVFTSSSPEEFKNTGVNSYDAIMADIEAITMAGLTQDNEFWAQYMDNMKRRSALVEAERDAAIARAEETGKVLLSKAEAQKEASLKANELAAKRDLARRDDAIEIQRDNLSRYQGFLQAKFEAAGMADSSAGLQLIGKYQAAADMQLRYAVEDRSDAQAMYLSRSEQIMSNYFDQAYEIEFGVADQKRESFFAAEKSLLEIDSNVLQATDTKQKNTLSALKELANAKMSAEQTKRAEIMQLQQMALEESKFEHQKVQDQIQNEQWEQNFGLTLDEAIWNRGFNLKKFEEDTRRWGLDYAIKEQEMALRKDEFRWDQTKYWSDDEYRRSVDDRAAEQWKANYDISVRRLLNEESSQALDQAFALYESGGLTSTELKTRMAEIAPGVIGSILDTSTNIGAVKYGDEAFADRVSFVEQNAANMRAKNGADWDCVEYVREIIPDMPRGLNYFEDKMRILVDSPNGIDFPVVGAVMVERTGHPYGHVSVVTDVNLEAGTFNVTEFNWKGPVQSTRPVKMDNENIGGFWLSPKLGYEKEISYEAPSEKGIASLIAGGVQAAFGGGTENFMNTWSSMFNQEGKITGVYQDLGTVQKDRVTSAGISLSETAIQEGIDMLVSASGLPKFNEAEEIMPGSSDPLKTIWNLSRNMPNADTDLIKNEALGYIMNGDREGFSSLYTNTVVESMPETTKKDFGRKQMFVSRLDDALQSSVGMESNRYKAWWETDVKSLAAQAPEEQWRKWAASVVGSVAEVRNELLGVAMTPAEMEAYSDMLPDIDADNAETIVDKLQTLRRQLVLDRQTIFDTQIGAYNDIYVGFDIFYDY